MLEILKKSIFSQLSTLEHQRLKENLFLFHKKLKYPSIYNDKITTILTSSNHRKSPLFFKGGIFYGLISEKIFPNFFCKMTYLRVILCEKSIARIPEA